MLVRRLKEIRELAAASRIAAYCAIRGEISLERLASGARRDSFTLPRVVGKALEFVACSEKLVLERGSFGIPEPVDGEIVPLANHDVVLVPLVAFDESLHRVGQGGGFYDRALEPLPRPFTIGVAYSFQQIPTVPREPWDLPLDVIVTDQGIFDPRRHVA